MLPSHAALKEQFVAAFGPGGLVHIIRAPGRVNLIGEHTDYNDGFVCPMAIEPEVLCACRTREDGMVRLVSTAFAGDIVEFSVQRKIEAGSPRWANYCRGVAAELIAAGIPLSGMEMLLSNTLPVGGGLSSSAAVEVGTGLCLLTLAGLKMDPMRLALICQKAEHDYAGAPVGIMDPMIVATAHAGHATLFDCRSFSKQHVPVDPKDLRVVITNTMVHHEISGGEYGRRRQQCEAAVAFFRKENPQITALRDVTLKQVTAAQGKLDDLLLRRARHVVSENARATEAAAALQQQKYERAGELMVQSHRSLRDDYEVSCQELDFLVDEAMKLKGVYGARMTGGGFGGCIVALVQPRSVEDVTGELSAKYAGKFAREPVTLVTTATSAASVVG